MTRREEQRVFNRATYYSIVNPVHAQPQSLPMLDTWKKAYPRVTFYENDIFTGNPIDWEIREDEEIALFVAYILNTQAASVQYTLEVVAPQTKNKFEITHEIDDADRFWGLWFVGAFYGLLHNTTTKSKEAMDALIRYALQGAGEWHDYIEDTIDDRTVVIKSLIVRVGK